MFFGIGRLIVDIELTFGRHVNASKEIQKRGFTAAGRAHNAEELSLFNIEGDIVENMKIPKILGQVLYAHLVFLIIHNSLLTAPDPCCPIYPGGYGGIRDL